MKSYEEILVIADDLDFLRCYLEKLWDYQEGLSHCTENDVSQSKDTSNQNEIENKILRRIADIASKHKVQPEQFLPSNIVFDSLFEFEKYVDCKINSLQLLIAKIENFSQDDKLYVTDGLVFCGSQDLNFPSGQIIETMKLLIDSLGKTVTYDKLKEISENKYRHHIVKIRKRIKAAKIPYEIKTITTEGYALINTGA